MTRPKLRRLSGFLLLLPLFALAPADAQAGSFPYWGLSFGTSERTSASLGVSFGDRIPGEVEDEGFALGTGPVVEATVGLGGAKVGAGRSVLLLTDKKSGRIYADWKAVATRTWDRPRGASAHATYLGLEGGLSLSFVRFTLGVAKRLEEKSRGANVLVTWGAGLQVRMGKARRRADANVSARSTSPRDTRMALRSPH